MTLKHVFQQPTDALLKRGDAAVTLGVDGLLKELKGRRLLLVLHKATAEQRRPTETAQLQRDAKTIRQKQNDSTETLQRTVKQWLCVVMVLSFMGSACLIIPIIL